MYREQIDIDHLINTYIRIYSRSMVHKELGLIDVDTKTCCNVSEMITLVFAVVDCPDAFSGVGSCSGMEEFSLISLGYKD